MVADQKGITVEDLAMPNPTPNRTSTSNRGNCGTSG